MSVWFEGSSEIDCTIQHVKDAVENLGEHYVGVVSLMPGLTTVELIEQGDDFVTIKTNEGLMKRTNITKTINADSVVMEFDEEYAAGSMVTAKTHYRDEFNTSEKGIIYRAVLSGVETSGFLGFFYRKLGSSNIGNAVLKSYKTYLED